MKYSCPLILSPSFHSAEIRPNAGTKNNPAESTRKNALRNRRSRCVCVVINPVKNRSEKQQTFSPPTLAERRFALL